MSLRAYIIIILILTGFTIASAQQMSTISLFGENQSYYNPAANGSRDVLTANFFYRQTWVGMPGAASTQVFSVHTPLKNPKVAVGLLIEHDAIGSTGYTGAHFSYAYRLSLGESKLSFGLRAGITNGSQSNMSYRDEVYDPVLEEDNVRFWVPNFGFGILYYNRSYWVGLSLPRIFGFESNASDKYIMTFDVMKHEYFLTGGGIFNFNPRFGIEPSLLFEYSPSYSPRLSINAMGVYQKAYKAGIGYRHKEAIILLISINISRQFGLGYSYDLNIGELSDYSSGSHELNIHYNFGYKINASNPRGF